MYVLIHGGFHNNKCWHDVEQILRKNGKKVTSVLLPGHNETDIERLKDINVTACVESIINQIGETDEKLTLVFHSMAGIFIYDTYKKIGKEQIESIYCVACCIPAAGETMSDILKGSLHSFASFCAGKIQVVKRFPKILALAIFGNGMNKKQREKLYSSLCGESTNLLFERINECKLETSIKWILPTKDRALNPKQQRVYMNNIGNIKSIIKLGRRVSFEYSMVRGVNDSDACAKQLADLIRGMGAHVNLIPINPVDGSPYSATDAANVRRFQQKLESLGVNATVRRRLGSEISAACGQLRRDEMNGKA